MKTIQQIKTDLMMYLSYRLHHKYMVTEGPNASDVFSVNTNDFTHEFEIKTNKADLQKEFNCMFPKGKAEELMQKAFFRSDNKVIKHFSYKKRLPLYEYENYNNYLPKVKYIVPNRFIFVIPENLLEYALNKIHNMPYGIMTFRTDDNYDWWRFKTVKKSNFLHMEKCPIDIKIKMLDRSVNEVVYLRDKIYNKQ